jgi:hypothetical protein
MTDPREFETDEARARCERDEEVARLMTRDGQAAEHREALMQALSATNLELSGNGVQPRIDAVIQALTMLQAEFIAMYPSRGERRKLEAEVQHNLGKLITLRTSVGGVKPAKELATPAKVN